MKKALSVLLVAAALFGFYGSAVTVNDLLACKDYWEEAGEKSTADMNKLEDGLNQLKDNEQAYLDGQEQLAEGEKTLAEGEAAYEAAPKQLAEGEKAYSQLKTLISGLNTAKKHGVSSTSKHDKYWHDAFSKALAPGRQQIVAGLKQANESGVLPLLESLTGTSDLASKASNAKSYPAFDNVVAKQLIPTFNKAAENLNGFANLATEKANTLDAAWAGYNGLLALEANWATIKAQIEAGYGYDIGDCNAKNEEAFINSQYCPSNYKALASAFAGMSASPAYSMAPASALLRGGVAAQLSEFLNSPQGQMLQGIGAKGDASKAASADAGLADKVAALVMGMQALSPEGGAADAVFKGYMPQVIGGLNDAAGLLTAYAKTAKENADQFQTWEDGYQTLAHGKDGETSKKYPDDLASKTSGIPFAFKNMVTNSTIKSAIKKYDPSLMKVLKKYTGNRLKNDSMEEFDKDITYLGKKVIPRALKVLAKVKASAAQQLAEGRRSYAEAPGQLEAGRQQLADGKAQLAQYEDGEQQVRDGLATLFNTEADLDLESIADRLNGDGDFDNGDEHLDLDEGLNAVEVGRGYQADDGVLITNEIMGRAVATGGLLAAGVLAVLAAILSFLKKNKAAGVFALLAAAAGAFGAFYGPSVGTYFSEIAGSTIGTLTWVAAGVLGAVALVHAIVHFAAPKNA